MASILQTPARWEATIQRGSPWPGVRVRYEDADGNPEAGVTYTAQVRTNTISQNGVLLAQCDVGSEDADNYVIVSLDGETTRQFPERQVYIDVDAKRTGETVPRVIAKITATVEGEVTANVPNAPTGVTVSSPASGQVLVGWEAPEWDGGAPILTYTVTPYIASTPQTTHATADASAFLLITGLTHGQTYTFKVAATNDTGTGSQSSASSGVTP